ncbi:caspase family protein [Candidatus Bathyarchaeota archaeon]|nr:caspase family protein [Candidatus Bathyarchaeota archaeon]
MNPPHFFWGLLPLPEDLRALHLADIFEPGFHEFAGLLVFATIATIVADDDALLVLEALVNNYYIPREYILLHISDEESSGVHNATLAGIIESINWVNETSTGDDDVIIYFSGHGTGRGKRAGMVAQDGGVLWDHQLAANLTEILGHARRVAVIFDSCFSGGFLDDLEPIPNLLAIMAGRAISFEAAYGHGVFTYWLVCQGIINGYADDPELNPHAKKDGVIPLEEAYDYTYHNLLGQSKPKILDNYEGDFLPLKDN